MSSNVRANFRGMIRGTVFVACLSIAPAAAEAGWVAEWLNTAYKSNGERQDPQRSTMRIADGKIKVEQPHAVTLIDYARGRYTILNPQRKYFWTGSIDDYIPRCQGAQRRAQATHGNEGRGAEHLTCPRSTSRRFPRSRSRRPRRPRQSPVTRPTSTSSAPTRKSPGDLLRADPRLQRTSISTSTSITSAR